MINFVKVLLLSSRQKKTHKSGHKGRERETAKLNSEREMREKERGEGERKKKASKLLKVKS